MIEFWFAAGVLLVAAMCFVALPLLWKPAPPQNTAGSSMARAMPQESNPRGEANLALYQQRLQELTQDLDDGVISANEFQLLKVELQRNLIADFAAQDEQGSRQQQSPRSLSLWLAMIMIPLLAILLYQSSGALADWQIYDAMKSIALQSQNGQAVDSERATLMAALEKRSRERPDNGQYLIMLARFYMAAEDYDKAALSYGKLLELEPQEASLWGYYAQALYMAQGRQMTAGVKAAADRALQLNPHQTTTLGLLGIAAFEAADYRAAIDYWQRVIRAMGPHSAETDMLRRGIAQAEKLLQQQPGNAVQEDTVASTGGEDSASEDDASQTASLARAGLFVRVSVGQELAVDPEDTVYVFAKAANGPPMPLAVARFPASELPRTVELNDSMAMTPALKLSSFDQILITARVSRGGSVTANPGDLEGRSGIIDRRQQAELAIEIDQILP